MLRQDSSRSSFGSLSVRRLGKAAILPISAHAGLLILFDLGDHFGATLLLVGAGFMGVLLAERQLRGLSWEAVVWPCLAVAAVLRVLLLPIPPSLSEDIERYVWDGRVLKEGLNPYLLPPDAPELTPLRDPLWEGLPHREVPTVYPPMAEVLFAVSASLPRSVFVLKTMLIVLDLAACFLLLRLARTWSLPLERTLWYAWNPLVTMEIAGMGHIDGFGVFLVVLVTALLARFPRRLGWAAAAAAGAVLTKLVPVLAVPVWSRQSHHKIWFALLALGLCVAGLLPVVVSADGVPPGLSTYAVSWEFNGPLFEPLWRLLDRTNLVAAVETGLNRLKEATNKHELWNRLYPLNYPQLWAKMMLGVGLVVALIWSWRTAETARSLRRVFGSVLIFSATVYPWYALWVLPWAALTRHRAWLVLSVLLFLSYAPKFWGVPMFPWIQVLIWCPFSVLILLEWRWSTP